MRRPSVLTALFLLLPAATAVAAARSPAPVSRHYTVYATDGYITMPDGNVIYTFGFNDTGIKGQVVFPAPLLWANVGDEVSVTLVNLGFHYRPDLTDPHTVHLHGMHVTPYFDGFPESSWGVPMGESFTYRFTPMHEGTFMYHCHVEAVEHVQMGMYGPLVVYAGDGRRIYGQRYTKEYIWLLSEIDSRWHHSLEPGVPDQEIPPALQTSPPTAWPEWVRINYRPDYWLINGLSFPDTIRTGDELPILTHDPSGRLAGIQRGITVANAQPAHAGLQQSALLDVVPDEHVLVRVVNIGYETHSMHLHGEDFDLVGSDAHALPVVQDAAGKERRTQFEKFTLLIGSGETYDALVDYDSAALCHTMQSEPAGGESPFREETAPLYTPDGPLFFPAHCHDDYHVTNQGAYPGGMTTLVKVQRPSCRPH
jgi:FtsP/CotA-like multicopper oxidase with cupredoxin domain